MATNPAQARPHFFRFTGGHAHSDLRGVVPWMVVSLAQRLSRGRQLPAPG
jgi:hypothetical protein